MNLQTLGEFGFIDRIKRGCLHRKESVIKAIGDDCAAYRTDSEMLTLVTTDLLIERVHFVRASTSGYNLGHKALTVNLSDIAAMGGIPGEAFVSLAIPQDCDIEFLDDLYRGMKSLASEHKVNILGGDTTSSPADLVINIALTGSVDPDALLLRSSAQPGDIICITGYPGESKAGLHFILNNIKPHRKHEKMLVNRHLFPRPFIDEGQFLAQYQGVHAGIDISDGLSSDCRHLAKSSKVGVRLFEKKLPISPELQQFCEATDTNPLKHVLAGGEDYLLLVTIHPSKAEPIASTYAKEFGSPLFQIGEIYKGSGMELVHSDGTVTQLKATGWDHFEHK
ncbi:MAG: thiamine-phosphate kinase [Chitinivibrionales bacterium]|nr:thiamine-phosphate kinase [Chitinivibrionales bacterium]